MFHFSAALQTVDDSVKGFHVEEIEERHARVRPNPINNRSHLEQKRNRHKSATIKYYRGTNFPINLKSL